MILLDINVVSELMRPFPIPAVESWVADRLAASLFFFGNGRSRTAFWSRHHAGRRAGSLMAEIEAMPRDDFANRILPFDGDAARAYAVIAASRRVGGRPIAEADCQNAAITRSRGMALATS